MAVRRIHADQPDSFAFTPETLEKAKWWLAKYPGERKRSAVIPILWLAQKQAGGWLPEPALRAVGDLLDMPRMRVIEVATFYSMFNLAPVGRFFIQLCGTTPCWLRGADALKAVCEERIGPKGTTSPDGLFTWAEVECLGACCNAPMIQISTDETDHYYEDLTGESFATLLDDLANGRAVKAGPQSARTSSEPAGESTSLTDATLYDGSRAAPLAAVPNAPGPDAPPEPGAG